MTVLIKLIMLVSAASAAKRQEKKSYTQEAEDYSCMT
jgi:hypothetical protein